MFDDLKKIMIEISKLMSSENIMIIIVTKKFEGTCSTICATYVRAARLASTNSEP